MIVYTATRDFIDLKDNEHLYHAGELFPRAGLTVSEERVAELASTDNASGSILIKAVEIGEISKPSKAEKQNKKEK